MFIINIIIVFIALLVSRSKTSADAILIFIGLLLVANTIDYSAARVTNMLRRRFNKDEQSRDEGLSD